MRINNNNQTSFNAQFIKPAKVYKYNPATKGYQPIRASFIQIDPENLSDVIAMNNIAKYWEHDKYAGNIAHSVNDLYKNPDKEDIRKVLAITTQQNCFEQLNDEQILGVAEIEKFNYGLNLSELQVNPKYLYTTIPKIKHIGTAMLNSIKKYYNEPITLISAIEQSVKDFYRSNKFKPVEINSNRYQWFPTEE